MGRLDAISTSATVLTLVLLAAAMAPLAVVPVPAMLDYVNHLARMYLLTGPASPAYTVRLGLSSDIAMDLLVPWMSPLLGVPLAAKVFLGMAEVLVVTGAMFAEWAVKRRLRLGGLGALLVLFSLPFAWGQLNFMFGLGLTAWGVGLWVWLRERAAGLRWAVHAGVVGALYFTHFFDLGIYGLTLGLYELSLPGRLATAKALLARAGFMASPVVLLLAMTTMNGSGVGQPIFHWDSFGLKIGWAPVFMNVYDLRLSILTGGATILLVTLLTVSRRLTLTRTGVWIAAGYGLIYLLLPRMMFDSQYLDVRLLTAAAMILPAFMTTRFRSGLERLASLGAIVVVIIANDASTAGAWLDYQADYRQFEASFPLLQHHSTVLIGVRDQADSFAYQPLFYAPTLAAASTGAFVSSLYSMRGMQPVEPRPAFRRLAVRDTHDYKPPRLSALLAAAGGKASVPGLVAQWPRAYRYLYVIGRPGPEPIPSWLTRIYAGRRFALYRVGS